MHLRPIASIVPGEPLESELYVLCTLPQDDEMFMPPEGNDPLSTSDLFMLGGGLKKGADWPDDAKLAPKKKDFTILGMLAKDLYQELGFEAGKVQDEFVSYRQNIETSNLNFEMLPVAGGKFIMGSPADDPNRGANEHLAHEVKVSDFGWVNTRLHGMNMNCGCSIWIKRTGNTIILNLHRQMH